ncbi:response regulator transcription factor [Alteribacter natronophilus]|uniref:response regulator transcription factor n=1 Tax=Alteribacter natronophilus TaxID=2583810 RepID=UPI00110E5D96|nr:response regulator transcription factor [Alteribacter natronophilus]TMW74122.1 response regulator transcription factor [Alteribacter natronophilus]
MGWTIALMFGVSALLFLLSFARKDPSKEMEKQLENFSISLMKEMYQLKKKVNVLEEEHMIANGTREAAAASLEDYSFEEKQSASSQTHSGEQPSRQLTRDDVLALYEEGYSVKAISEETYRTEQEIDDLLAKR